MKNEPIKKDQLQSYLFLKYGSEAEIHRMWFAYQRKPNTVTPQGDMKLISDWLHYEYID